MADTIELLQELGFGEYEARAYQALLQHNPITGYELAKVSGIPRPNIYPVLQKLEERGAVVHLDSGDTTRYLPVPPEEFLKQIEYRFQHTVQTAKQALQELAQPAEYAHVWHVQGYENMLSHARALIDMTDQRLLMAVWPDEARALTDALAQAEARGIELTTLCMAACLEECGGCRGRVYRYKVIDTQDVRWLMLIPDSKEMLAGEVTASGQASVVRTRQKLLVDMTSWFVRHSIALAVLLLDAGKYLEIGLESQTQAVLADVGPPDSGGWLAYMRRLLG
jgi:predicted transcriptional regulator